MTRVLVPMDGSSQSEAALEQALSLFPEADITVLHVVQITEFPDDKRKSPADLALERADSVVDSAVEIAREHDREIDTEIIEGHAGKTILNYADEISADHIVMGSTGRSGLQRVLLGSVAERVVRRSDTPVTIIR
ncbi:MAG: universal stress protein [Halobacteriota archaeon]